MFAGLLFLLLPIIPKDRHFQWRGHKDRNRVSQLLPRLPVRDPDGWDRQSRCRKGLLQWRTYPKIRQKKDVPILQNRRDGCGAHSANAQNEYGSREI